MLHIVCIHVPSCSDCMCPSLTSCNLTPLSKKKVAVGALPTLQAAAEPCLSVANPTRRKPALCCRRLRDACQASSLRTAGAGSGCLLVSSRRRRPADSTGRGRAMLSRDRMCALGARFSAAVGSGSLARRVRSGRQERAAAASLCQVPVGALPTPQAAAEPCLCRGRILRASVPAFLLSSAPGPLPGELAQNGRSGQRLPPCVKSR